MDRGAWWATVHGVAKSGTRPSNWVHSQTHRVPSVQFSHSVVSDSLWPHKPQHARPPRPSSTPRVHPNSCPLSWWCHPTTLSSVVPFSSCPQSFPASGSFQMSPLEWTSWISLQSRQAYWSRLLRDPPKPGIKSKSLDPPALTGRFFTTVPPGKPVLNRTHLENESVSCSVMTDSLQPREL